MELLDLPIELVEGIILEMIHVVRFAKSNRLRLVNSKLLANNIHSLMMPGFFNRSIIDLAFSKDATEFLSSKLLTQPILKATCAEVLRVKIVADTARSSPLTVAVYQSIDLLESFPSISGSTSGTKTRRERHMAILCESVLDRLSLKEASEYLHSGQSSEDEPEPPIQGALTIAAASGKVALIRALLDNGAETCRTSKFFFSPLCTAAKYGNLKAISAQQKKGTLDASCLIEACFAGHKYIVDVYLTLGSHPDYAWWEIRDMLLAAVAGSNYPLVQQIISICPIAEQSDFLQRAYFEAVKYPSLEMVEKLIDSGIEISLYHHGETALGMAAARGELAVVKLLLARGFDRSHLSYNDSSIQAAMEGHEHVVAFLLDEGIDINSRKKRLLGNRHMEGDRCVTALFSAALRREDYMFQFLLDRGAKLDPKDGKAALAVACIRRDERLRQFLLDAGLDRSRCHLTETAWVHDCLVSRARVGAIQGQ